MKPAPIKLTAEADEYLRRALDATARDMDAALLWTPHTLGENDLFCYEGPAVSLGWYRKGQRAPDSFFELCGHAVSITQATLEHIEGKTISSEKFATGFANGPPTYHVLKVG